jgi:hypothetical protein
MSMGVAWPQRTKKMRVPLKSAIPPPAIITFDAVRPFAYGISVMRPWPTRITRSSGGLPASAMGASDNRRGMQQNWIKRDFIERKAGRRLRAGVLVASDSKRSSSQDGAKGHRARSCPARLRSATFHRVLATYRSTSGNASSPCRRPPWPSCFPLRRLWRWSRRKI